MAHPRKYENDELIGECYYLSEAGYIGKARACNFRCRCGKEFQTVLSRVTIGRTKSCGCYKKDLINQRAKSIINGVSYMEYYRIWAGILKRCYNEKTESYNDYGGRGIKVCDRWLESFENFLADMGMRPTPSHSIDRVDNNKGYSPENCRWATPTEQARNKRTTTMLTYKNQTKALATWCEELDLDYKLIKDRIYKGYNTDYAFETPKLEQQRLILNFETGIYYDNVRELAQIYNKCYSTFTAQLNGKIKTNNTPFKYV